jgi:hypothetical protein
MDGWTEPVQQSDKIQITYRTDTTEKRPNLLHKNCNLRHLYFPSSEFHKYRPISSQGNSLDFSHYLQKAKSQVVDFQHCIRGFWD